MVVVHRPGSGAAGLDGFIDGLRAGNTEPGGIGVLFLPTGPLQEVSLSSGWGDEFCALADRYDAAVARAQGHAVHLCAVCAQEAGRLQIEGDELRRTSFTSTLTQRATTGVRAAIASAAALHALDPELAPFYCPDCEKTYCGDHWRRHDVFEATSTTPSAAPAPRATSGCSRTS